jgi:septum formation protein
MLDRIDLNYQALKPNLDEDQLKQSLAQLDLYTLGLELAKAKAQEISFKHPDAFVIGADQICELDGEVFDKPGSIENCIKHLSKLSGKTHKQNCFAVIYHNAKLIWHCHEQAHLTMRKLSDQEIRAYVEIEKPIHSCGSYMLEKHGKYLFEKIEGDHDVILGLPLITLLNKLFEFGVIAL